MNQHYKFVDGYFELLVERLGDKEVVPLCYVRRSQALLMPLCSMQKFWIKWDKLKPAVDQPTLLDYQHWCWPKLQELGWDEFLNLYCEEWVT